MPQTESKVTDPSATAEAVAETVAESTTAPANGAEQQESGSEGEEETNEGPEGPDGAKKVKKSRKKKIKDALTGKGKEPAEPKAPGEHLSKDQISMLLEANPALKNELQAQAEAAGKKGTKVDLADMVKKLSANDLLTGTSLTGKNVKDMASHAFWKTQPVLSYEEMAQKEKIQEGPIKQIDPERVDKEPSPMYPGFEWVTMDLEDEKQLEEVYDLLSNHYVEDTEAMFRFKYSPAFLNWALKAPGWRKEWHVGVRATQSGKLVAFISGIPVDLRVRENVIRASEINFLCVHKKLRSKRLTPVLIKEITRRCFEVNIYQAIYTVGSLLPTPVSTCRYYHRALDWEKLYEVGFSPLPPNSTRQRQIIKYKLPEKTSTPGLRLMETKDIDSVLDLLKRYLARTDMAQIYTREEVEHWLCPPKDAKEQVVWSYVVEDPSTKKITDYFSFYRLESTVIGNKKHNTVNAAYLFYYATETAFEKGKDTSDLKKRLNQLIKDALILAKNEKFDVFNALTLMDNPLFLEEQRFGAGDGMLHFYLYNYRAVPIGGGMDAKNQPSEKTMGGVGVVML